jgi:phage tail sheath gpL-like
MANTVYSLYKQQILGAGGINLTSDTIKVALITASYTPNYATDQYYSICSANVVGTPQQITSPSVTGGVFNGAGVTFSSVSGSQVTQMVIYKDTGTASTSPLIANINVSTGLPVTPNGGNITISWDTGANKIFAL